jgi:hypothetical protein
VKADATLGRAAGIVVLHAEASEDLHVPVIHPNGDAELVLALGDPEEVPRRAIEVEQIGHMVELPLGHLKRVE